MKTGNQQCSGTDSNVYIKLEDEYGICTEELKLDILFYDDLERGSLDSYKLELPEGNKKVSGIFKLLPEIIIISNWSA